MGNSLFFKSFAVNAIAKILLAVVYLLQGSNKQPGKLKRELTERRSHELSPKGHKDHSFHFGSPSSHSSATCSKDCKTPLLIK